MQIGIFPKIFNRPTLPAILDAMIAHGIYHVQFSMDCAGVPEIPDQIEPELAATIRAELASRTITMSAISGTYNMIDPDLQKRRLGMQRLRTLASACSALGTSVITICTGSRDPISMWHRHPDNDSPEAWRDLVTELGEALTIAEQYGVTLAFEPEVNNVVDSALKGRRVLDEMQSRYLKVCIDGANLFHAGELPQMRAVLDRSFELLGADIVLAHAKDLTHDGDAGHEAAGQGMLDYTHYIALLHQYGYTGPLVLHSLTEDQVGQCVAFLREKLAGLETC